MVDFLGRDRRSNLARLLQFGQGIKSLRRPNITLKIYSIKQSRRLIARRNPTTLEHQDVEYGVKVGWTRWICFIAPRGFLGGHGRMGRQSTNSWCKKWVLYSTLSYLLAGGCGDICNDHRTTLSDITRQNPSTYATSYVNRIHKFSLNSKQEKNAETHCDIIHSPHPPSRR